MLCRVCAQQLLRDGAAPCPQCRAEVAEATLEGSADADAAAAELAERTLDAEGMAEWKQRLADGKALAERASTAAAGDGTGSTKVEAELKYMLSAAPTGSTKCKLCADKIAQHSVRMHASGGYVHLACTTFASDWTAARNKAREGAGTSGAEVVLNVQTTPEFHGPSKLGEEQLASLKQKLREPAGSQPWWCVIRHKGPLWADEQEGEDDFPSDDEMGEDFDDSDSDTDSEGEQDVMPPQAHADMLRPGDDPERVTTTLTISAAPTDRARCIGCGETIPRGSPRLHEPTGPGFRHFTCRDFCQEWRETSEAARQGENGTVWLNVQSNVDAAGIVGLDRSMVQLLKQVLRSAAQVMPPWMWVRHRGSLWEANYGTPRAGAAGGSGDLISRLLQGGGAAAAAAGVGGGDGNGGQGGDAEGSVAASGTIDLGNTGRGPNPGGGASGEDGGSAAGGGAAGGGAARGAAAGPTIGDMLRNGPARDIFRAQLARHLDEQGGSGADSDVDVDDEDSSDEGAIAQAGQLGGVLHRLAGFGEFADHMDDEDAAQLEDDGFNRWNAVSLSYTTSAAPSDRAICKTCGEAIAQGSVVLAERHGGGYCHFGCKIFAKELVEICTTARAAPCDDAADDASLAEHMRQIEATITVEIDSQRSDRVSVRVFAVLSLLTCSVCALSIDYFALCSCVLFFCSWCLSRSTTSAIAWRRYQTTVLSGSDCTCAAHCGTKMRGISDRPTTPMMTTQIVTMTQIAMVVMIIMVWNINSRAIVMCA